MTRPPPSPAAASSPPDGLLPDTPAVVAVLLQNQARFLAFLERRLGSREQAEEVLQEALVKGVERHGALREEERAVAWFYRVLRNTMNDHFRRQASQRARQVDDAQVWDTLADPQDRELRDLVCGCVGRLLDTLKPEYADILRAVELQEEAVKDYGARRARGTRRSPRRPRLTRGQGCDARPGPRRQGAPRSAAPPLPPGPTHRAHRRARPGPLLVPLPHPRVRPDGARPDRRLDRARSFPGGPRRRSPRWPTRPRRGSDEPARRARPPVARGSGHWGRPGGPPGPAGAARLRPGVGCRRREEDGPPLPPARLPGEWMYHCHILEHAESGMMASFSVEAGAP